MCNHAIFKVEFDESVVDEMLGVVRATAGVEHRKLSHDHEINTTSTTDTNININVWPTFAHSSVQPGCLGGRMSGCIRGS